MDHQSLQLEYEGEQVARDPHHDIFCDVFSKYVSDLKAHQRWLVWPDTSEAEDHGAAWRDFRSLERRQFNYLCDMTGVDSDAARFALQTQLREQCAGGVQ